MVEHAMVMHAFDPSIQVTEGPGLLEFKALLGYRADRSQNKPNSRVSASGALDGSSIGKAQLP